MAAIGAAHTSRSGTLSVDAAPPIALVSHNRMSGRESKQTFRLVWQGRTGSGCPSLAFAARTAPNEALSGSFIFNILGVQPPVHVEDHAADVLC